MCRAGAEQGLVGIKTMTNKTLNTTAKTLPSVKAELEKGFTHMPRLAAWRALETMIEAARGAPITICDLGCGASPTSRESAKAAWLSFVSHRLYELGISDPALTRCARPSAMRAA